MLNEQKMYEIRKIVHMEMKRILNVEDLVELPTKIEKTEVKILDFEKYGGKDGNQ